MGTDIHMYIEAMDRYEDPKKWELVATEDFTYGQRNYDVFAVLADVRNGRGFAGVTTGTGFNIIAEPRGLPDDVSAELRRRADESMDHTPSWVLLKEVYDFDWTQTTRHTGIVSALEFIRMRQQGAVKPNHYCGGVSGPGITVVSPAEMADVVSKLGLTDLEKARLVQLAQDDPYETTPPEVRRYAELNGLYTQVDWEETYRVSCAPFLEWVEECFGWPKADKPNGYRHGWADLSMRDPADVRFVFWFDS